MVRNWNMLTRITAVGAVCSLIIWIGTSLAGEETSVLVKKPVDTVSEGPSLPPPANPNQSAAESANSQVDPFAPTVQPPPLPPQTSIRQPPQHAVPQTSPLPNTTAKRPFMRPAVPRHQTAGGQNTPETVNLPRSSNGRLTSALEPLPAPDGAPLVEQGPALDVRPAPPIEYDTDHDARKLYRASGEVHISMVTQNPADGCLYEIPLCIPGCCVGEPSVTSGRGLLGRGVVEYCWPCGFKAEVKFRQLLGDVKVEYEGD